MVKRSRVSKRGGHLAPARRPPKPLVSEHAKPVKVQKTTPSTQRRKTA